MLRPNDGFRYFQCTPGHGVLVVPQKVARVPPLQPIDRRRPVHVPAWPPAVTPVGHPHPAAGPAQKAGSRKHKQKQGQPFSRKRRSGGGSGGYAHGFYGCDAYGDLYERKQRW